MDITADFIEKVFSNSKIKPKYMHVLTSPEAINIYQTAFTSNTVDPKNNYELYEYIGDNAANTAVVNYFYAVFPQLRCSKSIHILNRLKIVHVSKDSYSNIAENLGFWPYIRYNSSVADTKPQLKRTKEALLEDVFEAFVGATQIIITNKYSYSLLGVASQIIYNFIKSIFDEKHISFEPEALYDAKTRLKELFEIKKNIPNQLYNTFGPPKYIDAPPPSTNVVLRFNKQGLMFQGTGTTKQQAHKMAAQLAIDHFKKLNYNTEKKFNLACD